MSVDTEIEIGDGVMLGKYAAKTSGLNEDDVYEVIDVFGTMVYVGERESLPIPMSDVVFVGYYNEVIEAMGMTIDTPVLEPAEIDDASYYLSSLGYNNFIDWFSDVIERIESDMNYITKHFTEGSKSPVIAEYDKATKIYGEINKSLVGAADAIDSYGESFSIADMIESAIIQ